MNAVPCGANVGLHVALSSWRGRAPGSVPGSREMFAASGQAQPSHRRMKGTPKHHNQAAAVEATARCPLGASGGLRPGIFPQGPPLLLRSCPDRTHGRGGLGGPYSLDTPVAVLSSVPVLQGVGFFLSDSTESQSREYLPSGQDIPPRLKFPASFLEGSPMIWHPEQLAIRFDALKGWDGIWQ